MAASGGSPPMEAPLAVVTGANTGIGFHVASRLAVQGYHVLACRDQTRGDAALGRLRDLHGQEASVEVELLDLSSFASTRAFAARLGARRRALPLLVCNAGLNSASVSSAPEAQLTGDGVDVLYQTNFLSHFLLVLLLLPLLRAARGRVISVTSCVHRSAATDAFGLVRLVREPYLSLYGLSKLAQILASYELHRRFGDQVAFHCVNPGGVASDIWRNYPAWQSLLFKALLMDADTAARVVVKACLCEEGRAPAPPAYWNGYQGASRLPALECPRETPSCLPSRVKMRATLRWPGGFGTRALKPYVRRAST